MQNKKEYSAWSLIFISLVLGSVTTSSIAGCKPKSNINGADSDLGFDVDAGVADSNITASAETPSIPATETPSAATEPAAKDAAEPAVKDAAQMPAADAKPAELVAAERTAAAKKTEPVDTEKTADKVTVDKKTAENKTAENKTAENKTAENKTADKKTPENKTAATKNTGGATAGKSVSVSQDPQKVLDAGGDWPQWGGTYWRNNVPGVTGLPETWKPGKFDRRTGDWDQSSSENIRWVSRLGSQTYGNPVIANDRVYVGTNNGSGHLARYPSTVDLGVLLCFDEKSGELLWQHSSEKLITGRVHDWPLQGVCSSAMVEGDRLWFVTNRGEVRCLDTKGFHDGEDNGPVKDEVARVADLEQASPAFKETIAKLDEGQLSDALKELLSTRGEEVSNEVKVATVTAGKAWDLTGTFAGAERTMSAKVVGPRLSVFKKLSVSDKLEADVIWTFDMMDALGTSQHNMASCSVTAYGDLLFVNTGNGQDEAHINLPAPNAPSFVCLNKNTAEVYWTDKSPGINILHGQWSSPAVGEFDGVPQVIFAGGDGIIYSFRADKGQDGKPELLWQFDANPKESVYILGGDATRNSVIGTPVVYEGHVFIAVGEDPEHGEGDGHLYCIDPTKRGDISPELAMRMADGKRVPIPHKRIQAVDPKLGEVAVANPNSGAVWHYAALDQDADGEVAFEETMHRTIGTVAIKDDLLYITDLSGVVHCLDANGGGDGQAKVHFTYDMLAQSWGSPLIADGHVYLGDEDGDIAVFELGPDNKEPVEEINMGTSIYSTPVAANGTIFISTKDKLFAIGAKANASEKE